jgi:hypothetical protein
MEYTITEDLRSYNYSVELESGDAFAVSSDVQGMEFSVA